MTVSGEISIRSRRGISGFWVLIGTAVVVMVLGVVFARRFGVNPDVFQSPLIGRPAPSVVTPLMESDGALALDDLRGDIVVVNFWASWCTACRTEHGALLSAASAYKPFGVTFVAVNYQDQLPSAIGFLDELGRSPETVYVRDEASRTAFEFGVLGLPETFFIDRQGTIVGKLSGPADAVTLTDALDRILLGATVGEQKTGEVENLGD